MGTHQVGLPDIATGRKRSGLRLLAPLRYLQIWNEEKAKYDIIVPLAVGSILYVLLLWGRETISLFGDAGLLRYLRELLVMAVPFMVGALAAVAMGAPGLHLDRRPAGAELYLDGKVLTLRQFVCYLLGYLCFVAIFVLIGTISATLLRDGIVAVIGDNVLAMGVVTYVATGLLSYSLAVLGVTVLWALYFLTDVVNRP